jgi:cytochrome c6
MKKLLFVCSFVAISGVIASGALAAEPAAKHAGEAKFKEQCAVCHPDGGNIINPKKTLLKKDRAANNIKTEADIIKTMRNPGPGMNKFDEKTISDKDARAIANYILKTF